MNFVKNFMMSLPHKLISRKFLSSRIVLSTALLCIAVSGYYFMYQLFFYGIGLDKIATDRYDAQTIPMKFEDFQWLKSRRVTPENPLSLTTHSIPELNMDRRAPKLHLYIELEGLSELDVDSDLNCAELIIEQYPTTSQKIVDKFILKQVPQQVITLDWQTITPQPPWAALFSNDEDVGGSKQVPNQFNAHLKPLQNSPIKSILLGTKIKVNLLWLAFAWLVPGFLLFSIWLIASDKFKQKLFWLLILTFLVLLFFRCGAFISNDFFLDTTGKAAVFKTSFGHLRHLLGAGEWYPHVYKQAGCFVLPFFIMLIEPFSSITSTSFYIDTFPLPRYIWFLAELLGVLTLTSAIFKYLSPKVAVVFPFIYATFPPIMFDLYNMEDDALLIIGMLFLVAILIRLSSKKELYTKDYALLTVVMFFMLSSKVTAAFLIFTIPIGFFISRFRTNFICTLKQSAILFCLFLTAFFGGKTVTYLCGPDVREAQPGYPFQDHVFWDMAWAANGLFDYDTAHPFFKKGTWRDLYVAEKVAELKGEDVETLFPNGVKRMRHSKIGDELIYKPDILKVLQNRPSFFLNNQVTRLWQRGILFYGYSNNNDNGWYWRLDGGNGRYEFEVDVPQSFEENVPQRRKHDNMGGRGIQTVIQKSRYDEVWKIFPQIFVNSLLNLDKPQHRLANIGLTIFSMIGIICLRRMDLAFVFICCIFAKITFNTSIHGVVRYFDWVHIPMLIGLSVVVTTLVSLAWSQSRKILKSTNEST